MSIKNKWEQVVIKMTVKDQNEIVKWPLLGVLKTMKPTNQQKTSCKRVFFYPKLQTCNAIKKFNVHKAHDIVSKYAHVCLYNIK